MVLTSAKGVIQLDRVPCNSPPYLLLLRSLSDRTTSLPPDPERERTYQLAAKMLDAQRQRMSDANR